MAPGTGAAAAATAVDVGWCKLTVPDDPKTSLVCELGDGPPIVTQGYGGWDEIDRTGRISLTTWRGFPPIAIDLLLMLDNHAAGTTIEPAMTVLEAMAGRGELRAGGQPPRLIVDTAGVMAHDYRADRDNRWVITDLSVDADTVIVNDYGNWTRAAVTVSLLQHVSDDGLATRSAAVRERIAAKAPAARQPYTSHSGDTVVSIARAKLGDAGRWREIATLNAIRDPRAPLKAGRRIRLP